MHAIATLLALLTPGIVWTQQTRAIPEDWESVPADSAFFVLHMGELVLYPFCRVDEINGIRLPHGPIGEFPLGRYVLADLTGRVAFIGHWPEPLRGEVAAEIERRRREACEQRAATVMH